MQGQRSTIDPFPDAFEFSHGSASTRAIADQQHLWSDVLNPAESGLANYLPSASTTNMAYTDGVGTGTSSMSGWTLGESSSSDNTRNQVANYDAGKFQLGWPSSSTGSGATSLLEEQQHEPANCVSFGSLNINLNSSQITTVPFFGESPGSDDAPQILNLSAGYSGSGVNGVLGGQATESGICSLLHKPGGSEMVHPPPVVGTSNSFGTASGSGGYNASDRPGCSMETRRSSCKRKAVEGEVSGQLSLGRGSSCFNHAETSAWSAASSSSGSSNNPTTADNGCVNNLGHPQLGISFRTISSDSQAALQTSGIGERAQRNSRLRVNPTHQQGSATSNLSAVANAANGNIWHSPQSFSRVLSSNQSLVSNPAAGNTRSQIQSRVIPVPGLPHLVHPFPLNGATSSRGPSSSSSHAIPGDRSSLFLDDVHPRTIRRNISEQPFLNAATDMRNMAQDLTNWSVVSVPRNSLPVPRVSSSSRIHGFPAPSWIPPQVPPPLHPQRPTEARQSLGSSSVSELGAQSSSNPLVRPGPTREASRRGPLQVHSRSGARTQADLVRGGPLAFRALAAVEGRSRLLSEIRSVLDFIRSGGSVTFEDFALLNQSILLGVTDLHDRHRDMRLDVDNMSYEELLALEERIGNVSTGLSEENILKKMKQRKFLSTRTDPSDVEPCCICQEEYSEAENLGVLECGHDFHANCIKQWLMQKNSCPICKTTGLAT
ncbi:hypothetical protein Scep_020240 [Stephania cephalantha]|uniref:RING-type E3 ubiquitin transferase n=1 Tax=Stephania cephalantha TaxID=152367 RepID=A0AAP0NQM6_9MAGN